MLQYWVSEDEVYIYRRFCIVPNSLIQLRLCVDVIVLNFIELVTLCVDVIVLKFIDSVTFVC